jgi:hypothetical protein
MQAVQRRTANAARHITHASTPMQPNRGSRTSAERQAGAAA